MAMTSRRPRLQPLTPGPGSRRDTLRGLGAVLAAGSAGLVQGCATPASSTSTRSDAFSFREGIGARDTGPLMDRLADPTGRFPTAWRTNWWQPSHSVDAFSRLDTLFDSAISPRGEYSHALARAPREPDITWGGSRVLGTGRFALDDYLSRNPVTGLLIAKDDTILVERYQYSRSQTQRFTSFSMAKTLIALLVGCALEDGRLRALDDPAERYAKALSGSAYGSTPIRHLLTMSSGIRFREDYDGNDDSARLSRATLGGQTTSSAAAATQFDERIAAPGERWYYASADTYVLALALRAAIDEPIARYFSRRIWQPLGAQADASWLIDRSGQELGYMGFSATLRDYARLGLMLAHGGTVRGRALLDRSWIGEMIRMRFQPAQTGRWYGYGYQTWIFPAGTPGFALLGVRGQAMMIDPASRTVMVNTAVRPLARDPAGAETVSLWQSLTRRL